MPDEEIIINKEDINLYLLDDEREELYRLLKLIEDGIEGHINKYFDGSE